MNTCYVFRSSCLTRFFPFGHLDGLQVRNTAFNLERLATAFMNNPDQIMQAHCLTGASIIQDNPLPP